VTIPLVPKVNLDLGGKLHLIFIEGDSTIMFNPGGGISIRFLNQFFHGHLTPLGFYMTAVYPSNFVSPHPIFIYLEELIFEALALCLYRLV
jgi:hypothetical protein